MEIEFFSLCLAVLLQISCLGALTPDRHGRVLRFPARRYLAAQEAERRRLRVEKIYAQQQAAHYTELSLQDSLTGIANRRKFNEFLSYEWQRACRTGKVLSLIMIDVDNFKLYNDYYGHVAGDVCLRAVASVLRRFGRRGGELIARYGGEEFAVIMTETNVDAARTIADKIRNAVLNLQVLHDTSDTCQVVSVSLGVACIQAQREKSPELLVRLADKALYQAKQAGRNRVAVYTPAPAEAAPA